MLYLICVYVGYKSGCETYAEEEKEVSFMRAHIPLTLPISEKRFNSLKVCLVECKDV